MRLEVPSLMPKTDAQSLLPRNVLPHRSSWIHGEQGREANKNVALWGPLRTSYPLTFAVAMFLVFFEA